uniref:AAA family ATPase n=1 Tax=Shewanella baltica TaxID=62322 RepID=UPI004047B8BB
MSKDEVAKFIGRKQDIEEASRKLFEAKAQNECLTILGAGGLGKTSLVKKLAYEYNERNLFDCGIFFIDCEHLTSYQQFHRHIAGAFELADSVDVIEHVSENPEFRHGERLIIIDNAESLLLLSEKNKILHLLGRVNELATLIVTSRESLDIPSESTYQLRDFVADEAFELFESKAKRQFLTEEALFLKEHILKEYLDHNPLAISLVSSAMIRGKNLEELRDDLKENFFELTRKDQGSSINPEDRNIDRRSSIYNSIDYSYKHLALQSKEALIKLSYFPDGIDLVNFKKLTEQDAKSKGKAPIKDVTIKALQDKSLVQTSQHYIRLHPLVARFAKSKVNPEDEATYLQTIFEFQLSFVKSLALLGRDYNLDKQVLAKKIANTQINNFCFMLEKLSPNFNEQDIADYYGSLSSLLGRLEIYQDLYDALTLSVERFKNNTALYRLINIGRLSNEYYLGNFNLAYLKLHDLLPVKNWLALDYNNNIERATFVAASAIYGNEGMEIEEAIYYKKHGIKDRCYDSALRNIGVLSQKWAQVCMKNAESLYVKWTMSELTLEELNDYFEHMHPKAHIQIAVTLTLKAKLTRLNKDEISKLVVVNPYTQGVKYLLGAMSAENTAEAKKLFKQALPELKHIKFAYTEALLEYATWLDTQGDSEFETVYNEGLASARQYHYRFLQHGFLQIKMDTKIAYNEADYPLPDDEDFSSYIKQLIGYCEKSNKLK